MGEIKKDVEAKNHINIGQESHKQKSKQYINGENVYTYSKLKKYFYNITIKEKTIFEIKNLLSFILGILLFAFLYVKPKNIVEFFTAIKTVICNMSNMIESFLPISYSPYKNDNKYHYLIMCSYIICIGLSFMIAFIFSDYIKSIKYKIYCIFIICLVLTICGTNLEYKFFPVIIKIQFCFKFFSTIIIIIFSIILYIIFLYFMIAIMEFIKKKFFKP